MPTLPVVSHFLRTEEARFAGVPDFPYTPRYTVVGGLRIAHIEDVQDLVEVVLAELGQAAVVAAYKRYRKLRNLARDHIRVRDAHHNASKDVTDASLLLVESVSTDETLPWDRARIVKQLTEKIKLPAA